MSFVKRAEVKVEAVVSDKAVLVPCKECGSLHKQGEKCKKCEQSKEREK